MVKSLVESITAFLGSENAEVDRRQNSKSGGETDRYKGIGA